MRKTLRILLLTVIVIAASWILLTIWVERPGPSKVWEISPDSTGKKVLIVFDPDPIYNLDEQVCRSFGRGLAEKGMKVTVASVKATQDLKLETFDLFVLCSNTYNWRPDISITSFIEQNGPWENKQIVAITLGAGSTTASQVYFEKVIMRNKANLLESKSLWLMRPNDESRLKESNTQVADSLAYHWAMEVAGKLAVQRDAENVK